MNSQELVMVFICLIALSGCASWDNLDRTRQGVFLGALATDTIQSIHMPYPEYYETNRLLGKNPRRQKVVNYNILSAIVNTIIVDSLPEDYRGIFQYISIGVELEAINNNRKERN